MYNAFLKLQKADCSSNKNVNEHIFFFEFFMLILLFFKNIVQYYCLNFAKKVIFVKRKISNRE